MSSVHNDAATAADWTREYDIAEAVTDTEQREQGCLLWLQRGLCLLDGGMGVFWMTISILLALHKEENAQNRSLRWVVFGLTSVYTVLYLARCGGGAGCLGLRIRYAKALHNTCTLLLIVEHLVIGVGISVLTVWDEKAMERSIAQALFQGLGHVRKIWVGFAICLFLEIVRWVLGELVLYEASTSSTPRAGVHEPLLWGWLEFESETEEEKRREWATKSAQDPLWWSREEDETDEEERRTAWASETEI